jgi:chemotaxis protein histidine kinase CheA
LCIMMNVQLGSNNKGYEMDIQKEEIQGIENQGNPETCIRVNVILLDSLMTLAGELVLCRNQLLQTIGSCDSRNVDAVGQQIYLNTSKPQESTTNPCPLSPGDKVISHRFVSLV